MLQKLNPVIFLTQVRLTMHLVVIDQHCLKDLMPTYTYYVYIDISRIAKNSF